MWHDYETSSMGMCMGSPYLYLPSYIPASLYNFAHVYRKVYIDTQLQVHACQLSYSCIYTYMGKGMCQTADLYIAQDVINKKTVSIPIWYL